MILAISIAVASGFLMCGIGFFISLTIALRFMDFCVDNEDKWWGGFPLWMAVFISLFLPAFITTIALSTLAGSVIYKSLGG